MSMNDYFRLKRRTGYDHSIRPLNKINRFFSENENDADSDSNHNEDFSQSFERFLQENDESLV